MIHTERVQVTPDMAAAWLAASRTTNRPDKQGRVAVYAGDMRAGRWLENGEPLIFDGAGNILNGHNRLQAVVLAGVPVWFLVVRGVSPDAFPSYDQQIASRTRSDVLAMHGVPNAAKVRALASLVWLAMNGRLANIGQHDPTYRPQVMLDLVEADADRFQTAVNAGATDNRKFRPLTFTHAAFLRYWLPQYDEDRAAEFCDRLADGADLSATSPVALLRARLSNIAATTKTRTPAVEKMALILKAWRHHYHGEEVRQLKWAARGDKAEPFPDPDPRNR